MSWRMDNKIMNHVEILKIKHVSKLYQGYIILFYFVQTISLKTEVKSMKGKSFLK